MKLCLKCREMKVEGQFGVDRSRKDGRAPYCRECRCSSEKTARKAGTRKYVKPPVPAEKQREYMLRSRYRLEIADYEALLAKQDHRCGICRGAMEQIQVDHCHTTGEVRGLLCKQCNLGIGGLRDSIRLLESAIQYLRGERNYD